MESMNVMSFSNNNKISRDLINHSSIICIILSGKISSKMTKPQKYADKSGFEELSLENL